MKLKTNVFILLFFALCVSNTSAQNDSLSIISTKHQIDSMVASMSEEFSTSDFGTTFEERDILIQGNKYHALVTQVNGDLKKVKKSWSDYMKSEHGVNYDQSIKKNELNVNKISLFSVSDKRGDLTTVFYRNEGITEMANIFKLGYDVQLNSAQYPEEFAKLQTLVERFAKLHFESYYEQTLKNYREKLEVAKKELKQEGKIAKRYQRRYTRLMKKTDKGKLSDKKHYQVADLSLKLQMEEALVSNLKKEVRSYEYSIMRLKQRNSLVRNELTVNQKKW